MTEPTIAAPILLVRSGGDAAVPDWQAAFAPVLPNVEVRGWNDPTVDPADVAYALVWEPEPGRLARYKNLRLIFSTAAGVDHIAFACDDLDGSLKRLDRFGVPYSPPRRQPATGIRQSFLADPNGVTVELQGP